MLHKGATGFTWVGETYPAQSVSLRTSTPDNVVVQVIGYRCYRHGGPSDARRCLYIKMRSTIMPGLPYLVEDSLDWERGVAFARRADVDYYTVATAATRVERLTLRRQQSRGSSGG